MNYIKVNQIKSVRQTMCSSQFAIVSTGQTIRRSLKSMLERSKDANPLVRSQTRANASLFYIFKEFLWKNSIDTIDSL